MIREIIGRLYNKLIKDRTVAEQVKVTDKDLALSNEANDNNGEDNIIRAFLEEAATAIVFPMQKTAGGPFILDEMLEGQIEQLAPMVISEDELNQVSGGGAALRHVYGKHGEGYCRAACA